MQFETLDHKPSVPCEKKRIEENGGEIRTLRYDDFTVDRIFVKDCDYPGLCMSRSFGDECVKGCGVTSVPEITGGRGCSFIFLSSTVCGRCLCTSMVLLVHGGGDVDGTSVLLPRTTTEKSCMILLRHDIFRSTTHSAC